MNYTEYREIIDQYARNDFNVKTYFYYSNQTKTALEIILGACK